MTTLNAALQSYFGFSSFRPGQAEAIQSLLSGYHTLAVMPTGAGKSLIFQLAALLLDDGRKPAPTTLVISPLIALMKDQVDSLTRRNIAATYINSTLPSAEQSGRLRQFAQGKYRLVYVAPERLRSTPFLNACRSQPISLLAVDEAHCISEWGHDFRPDYLNIAEWRKTTSPPVLTVALTATATPKVQQDIWLLLGLEDPYNSIVTGFNRPNLFLNVLYTSGPSAKLNALSDLLSDSRDGATIIYTGTRRDAEEVAEFGREVIRTTTEFYHAGLPAEERSRIQEAFIQGKVNLVVATNAFGMGIDRADVRQVIHFSLPGSLEAYYQEAGRAGRDGLPACVTLLYDPKDRALQEFFIQQSELSARDLNLIFKALPAGKKIWITVDDLSYQTGLHPVQIRVGLSALERAGALDHLGDEGLRMMYRYGEWDERKIEQAIQHSQQHSQARQQELNSIIRYAESYECRRRIILRYFGDPDDTQAEECCDNCCCAQAVPKSGVVTQMSHGERAALIVLDCIRRLKVRVRRRKLAQILHGSKARGVALFHHDKNPYYARLAAVKQRDIEKLTDQLVGLGYIKVISGDFAVLGLTPRGENAIKHKEIITLKLPDSLRVDRVRREQRKLEAGGTVEYTASLFEAGMSPEQIAKQRGLAPQTIYRHLAQLIAAGKLPINKVVPDQIRTKIEQVIKQVGSSQALAPIKALLPDEIDYNMIRCVVAGLRQVDGSAESITSPEAVESFLNRPHYRRIPGPWATGWSLGFHSGFSGSEWSRSLVGELTYRLKYEGDLSVLPALVEQTLDLIRVYSELSQVDFIVPVPPSQERMVDPVRRFCEALGVKLNLPVRGLVEKNRVTHPQKEMKTLAQKRANVSGAFALRVDVIQKRVLLIDDLFDSGATLEEITRLFFKHGAAGVNVFTLTCTIHSDL